MRNAQKVQNYFTANSIYSFVPFAPRTKEKVSTKGVYCVAYEYVQCIEGKYPCMEPRICAGSPRTTVFMLHNDGFLATIWIVSSDAEVVTSLYCKVYKTRSRFLSRFSSIYGVNDVLKNHRNLAGPVFVGFTPKLGQCKRGISVIWSYTFTYI